MPLEHWISDYVNGLSPSEIRIHTAIAVIMLAWLLYRVYRTHHRYRYINDTATSRIASAAQGYVELKGLAEWMPGGRITSPFSQSRCVWYQCIMEKRQHLNDDEDDWVEISNETSDQLFHLQDESGKCVVVPDGAKVTPASVTTWYGHSEQARFQVPQQRGWSRFFATGKYRFSEKLIGVADPVYAIGQFETRQNIIQPATLDELVDARLTLWRQQPRRYLAEFDQDKDGKISGEEWSRVRQKARQQVVAEHGNDVHHLLKQPADKSQPFVISALSEAQLLQRKRRQIILQIALFFLLLYVLLTALNARQW